MFFKDFIRIKASLNIGMSAAYSRLGDYDRADIYSNSALMEDPSFCKAVVRKF
jgi:hypothetical protein